MKKTKQTFFRPFSDPNQNQGVSGCRQFQGQDLKYDARRQFFKNKQKQWLDQQLEQKRQKKQQQQYQQHMYARQTQQLNRMRGMLEDNFSDTKTNIVNDLKKTNQQLDLERKEKERIEKQQRLKYERQEAEYLKQRGTKQQFHMNV